MLVNFQTIPNRAEEAKQKVLVGDESGNPLLQQGRRRLARKGWEAKQNG